MIELMIICALVLIICVTSSKVLYKFGVPMLLIFIVLGMLFGSDGIVGIYFDNFDLTSKLCSIGLVFIMFYGGFGTNWKMAKPIAIPAVLMSSLGVSIIAILTGLFCHFAIKTTLLEGLLIGAIVASTDAASVFTILRGQKLNLKGNLASFLELESGSNDPIAYMMTVIILTMMSNQGEVRITSIISMVGSQIIIGVLVGIIISKISIYALRNANFEIEGFYIIFVIASALLSYSTSEYFGGNGYLSVYLAGLIIGNSKIPHKKSLFNFLDGISWLMQIILFFMLGLLSFPSKLPYVSVTAVVISLFMIFIARPLKTFIILSPFKFSVKEKLFISWVGLRGAASVVFAIFAVTYDVSIEKDIFHIIFFIALFSVTIQGTLITKVAKRLDLLDTEGESSSMKTFTDYTGEINTELLEVNIEADSKWANKSIMDAGIPEEILIVMIKREDNILVPKGATVIKVGDIVVFSGKNIQSIL